MKSALLDNRSLILVSGEEAVHFLDNLLTCKVVDLADGDASFGALLTPQGKILYDFFLIKKGQTFLIDIHTDHATEFAKRLTFYKLRAKVDITLQESETVSACWGDGLEAGANSITDPRHPKLGLRLYGGEKPDHETGSYLSHCISLNIPTGSIDFQYGDAYPHEVLMDQFGGVDFKKGCYVGQEVVSRMQHRGTTKKRVLLITADNDLPPTGTEILADEKPAGKIGSINGNQGLALVRLDRIQKAETVMAEDIRITASLPDWVSFDWPDKKP